MTNLYWRLALTFALATAIASSLLLPLFPTTTYTDTSGYGTPIFAFEMAATQEDLLAIFGPDTDAKHAERVSKMDHGNRLDFGLILLYVSFLGLFSIAAYKKKGHKLWLVPAILVVVAGCIDVVENFMLLEITQNLNNAPLVQSLWLPVYSKFILIAMSGFACAYFIYSETNQLVWKVIGVVAMVACPFTLLALSVPAQYGWVLAHAITGNWAPLLLFSAYMSFTKNS